MWYLYESDKKLLHKDTSGLSNFELGMYWRMRNFKSELIGTFMQKEDLDAYIKTLPELASDREYEIIGDKSFCKISKRECEYCNARLYYGSDSYCTLKSCIKEQMDNVVEFAEFLKSNATKLNISTSNIDDLLKIFAEQALQKADYNEHYQVHNAEERKEFERAAQADMPRYVQLQNELAQTRMRMREDLLRRELGEDGYARYCEKQSKQKRRKSNESV